MTPTTDVSPNDVAWLHERLHAFLAARMPGAEPIELVGLHRTSAGQSRENWIFDLRAGGPGAAAVQPLILRRDPLGSLLKTDRRTEFAVLSALAGSGIPLPAARQLDEDGAALGRPSLIMDRVDGECDWQVLNGAQPLDERLALARRFLALLVDVQRVDWHGRGLDRVLGLPQPNPGLAELQRWESELRHAQLEPFPELELVIGWLRAHYVPTDERVLVHGDFKPGNALLRDGRIVALLDWETVHIGDPLEDLGWILNPTRSREHQIVGHWQRPQIVAEYERLTGRRVDPAALQWWVVFANFKLAVILVTGVREFVEGRLDRIHQAPTWILKSLLQSIREPRR